MPPKRIPVTNTLAITFGVKEESAKKRKSSNGCPSRLMMESSRITKRHKTIKPIPRKPSTELDPHPSLLTLAKAYKIDPIPIAESRNPHPSHPALPPSQIPPTKLPP